MFEKLRHRLIRQNRIYIMPSGRGVVFLAAVVVMVLTGATYNNNLIFILAFFLFSLFVVSMLQTHYNLKGAHLEFVGADDAFEGEPMSLAFRIAQAHPRLKRHLEIRTSSPQFKTLKNQRESLRSNDRYKAAKIEVLAWRRGHHPLPEMILETYFPLGLFRAWKVFRPKGELVVYPRAEGDRRLVQTHHQSGDEETGLRNAPDGDFGELKPYVIGESYHQIAWKHFAHTGQLFSKVHWGAEPRHYEIHWQPEPLQDLEAYLRQMSRWIVTAVEEGATFEVQTPTEKIEAGRGPEQARICLRALALVDGDKR